MPQLQKEPQKLSVVQLSNRLPDVLTDFANGTQDLGLYVELENYPDDLFKLSLKRVQRLSKTRTDSAEKSSVTDPESDYEMRQRGWRRKIFEQTSGAIKNTKQLTKELKSIRISETAASKRLAKW